jgi:hypothetical protein
MTILPKSIAGKIIAVLWIGLCIAVLVFGYMQQGIHDMPVAFIWFMLFLSAPFGILVSLFVAVAAPLLDSLPGARYEPFWDLVPYWTGCVVLGYLQWFVLLPLLWQRIFRAKAI